MKLSAYVWGVGCYRSRSGDEGPGRETRGRCSTKVTMLPKPHSQGRGRGLPQAPGHAPAPAPALRSRPRTCCTQPSRSAGPRSRSGTGPPASWGSSQPGVVWRPRRPPARTLRSGESRQSRPVSGPQDVETPGPPGRERHRSARPASPAQGALPSESPRLPPPEPLGRGSFPQQQRRRVPSSCHL